MKKILKKQPKKRPIAKKKQATKKKVKPLLKKKLFSKNLGMTLMKQSSIHDRNNVYACAMTSCAMIFSYIKGTLLNLDDYAKECIRIGAMRNDFYVQDYNLMAKAAGLGNLKFKTELLTANNPDKIVSLINENHPMIINLNGEHFECVDGYDATGDLSFTLDDPGYQNDTHMDGKTLELYHLENGKKIYSLNHAGKHRTATKIYWFE